MTNKEIKNFVNGPAFAGLSPELIETHISWVILAGKWAYKIKKPVKFSFLDFSTLALRHKYSFEEVRLNRRLTGDMYIDVQEIRQKGNFLVVSHDPKLPLVDFLVKMRRKKQSLRMDRVLNRGEASTALIESLAFTLAVFHRKAMIVQNLDPLVIQNEWEDILSFTDKLGRDMPAEELTELVRTGSEFLESNESYLRERLLGGYYRDVHGDLHCENVFLEEPPVVFDCIEFNKAFRRIDILNEIAFMCMDLEARGHEDLSRHFLNFYLYLNPVLNGPLDRKLFLFYKMYRASVRAKILAIQAASGESSEVRSKRYALAEYIALMRRYRREMDMLQTIDTHHLLW